MKRQRITRAGHRVAWADGCGRGNVRAPATFALVSALGFFFLLGESRGQDSNRSTEDPIRLIVRADDMGAAHGMNEACILSCREGIARSVEVIVPGPWFMEAVKLLRENPGIDVGTEPVAITIVSNARFCSPSLPAMRRVLRSMKLAAPGITSTW